MTIGIIGSGKIGTAFASLLAKAGTPAIIANSRGPASLNAIVGEFKPYVTAGTVAEAAQADLVLVAVPWSKVEPALAGVQDWNGRILIDATNPIEAPHFQLADLGGRLSSEVVAGLAPGARVVKAFNTLFASLLIKDAPENGRRVLFFSGDDADAKAQVAGLIEKLGFCGIDLGPLSVGGKLAQFPGGSLPALDLVKFG